MWLSLGQWDSRRSDEPQQAAVSGVLILLLLGWKANMEVTIVPPGAKQRQNPRMAEQQDGRISGYWVSRYSCGEELPCQPWAAPQQTASWGGNKPKPWRDSFFSLSFLLWHVPPWGNEYRNDLMTWIGEEVKEGLKEVCGQKIDNLKNIFPQQYFSWLLGWSSEY